jgi:hypothetical protein
MASGLMALATAEPTSSGLTPHPASKTDAMSKHALLVRMTGLTEASL